MWHTLITIFHYVTSHIIWNVRFESDNNFKCGDDFYCINLL